jgi:hypothetical protein
MRDCGHFRERVDSCRISFDGGVLTDPGGCPRYYDDRVWAGLTFSSSPHPPRVLL